MFDEGWVLFEGLSGSSVFFLEDFLELGGDVSSVTVQNWSVTIVDLAWVLDDDDLSVESLAFSGWVVLGIGADVSSSEVFYGDVLDVESDVVSGSGFWELFVMLLDGLDFGNDVSWAEFDLHSWLENSGLYSSDWNGSDSGDFVHILQRKSQWFVIGSLRLW